MTIEDTILIKISYSYVDGISADKLYNTTSISWVISQKKLEDGNIKYFCAVYNNVIQEVYKLENFERNTNQGKEVRSILLGNVIIYLRIEILLHDFKRDMLMGVKLV